MNCQHNRVQHDSMDLRPLFGVVGHLLYFFAPFITPIMENWSRLMHPPVNTPRSSVLNVYTKSTVSTWLEQNSTLSSELALHNAVFLSWWPWRTCIVVHCLASRLHWQEKCPEGVQIGQIRRPTLMSNLHCSKPTGRTSQGILSFSPYPA